MTWVRIDDAAPLHPKLLRVGAEAAWLWVAGLAYANRHVTDGDVPREALPALYPHDDLGRAKLIRIAERLVEVGLWTAREGGGWSIHGYAEYQREAMRSSVEDRRRWEAERKARQRASAREKRDPGDSGDLATVSHRDRGGTGVGQMAGHVPGHVVGHVPQSTAPVSQVVSQAPDPTRPDQEEEARSTSRPAPAGSPVAGATLSLLPVEDAPKVPRDVDCVFAHWQTATRHARAVLDTKRERAIKAALRRYSVDDLCRSIDGYARSPFHQGQNDTGARHDDITLIVRDAKHVEAGWDLATKHAPAQPLRRPPVPAPIPRGERATADQVRALRASLMAATTPAEDSHG